MAEKPRPEDYMTTEEVRKLFRICSRTVARWSQDGKLHPVRVGHRLYYSTD